MRGARQVAYLTQHPVAVTVACAAGCVGVAGWDASAGDGWLAIVPAGGAALCGFCAGLVYGRRTGLVLGRRIGFLDGAAASRRVLALFNGGRSHEDER